MEREPLRRAAHPVCSKLSSSVMPSGSCTKMYGKGRVFYSSLGHALGTWDNPDVYRMYFDALKWSLGLTDGDATPRPLK